MISYGWWVAILISVSVAQAREIPFYRALESTYPSGQTDIERLNRTTLSKKTQDWVQIEWESAFGVLQQGWLPKEELKTSEKLSLQLDSQSASGWRLTSQKKSTVHKLPQAQSPGFATLEKLTPVRIIGEHQTVWALSFEKSHGFVWWIDTDELNLYQVTIKSKPQEVTTADIFKRKLYDLSSHPEDINFQVASSEGIFLTRDGKFWSPIARFNKSNLPVVFSAKGTLFVGGFRSLDDGQTFTPTLRWDRIASQVIRTTKKNPGPLKILDLENFESSVLMTLGIGAQNTVKLISKDEGLNWEIFTSKNASAF